MRYAIADDAETAEADIDKAAKGLRKAEAGSIRLPNFTMPPLMNNHGAYIGSLGNVCRWLAERAERAERAEALMGTYVLIGEALHGLILRLRDAVGIHDFRQ